MDEFTEDHFDMFLVRQFGHLRPIEVVELRERMYDQYETDPEFYECEGWWRCHDDALARPARWDR